MGSLRVTLVVACTALLWSGCESLECESGTIEVNGECIVEAPVSCGEGTILTGGQCISLGVTGCGRGTYLDESSCIPEISLAGNAARLVDMQITEPSVLGDVFAVDLEGYSSGDILMFVAIHDPLSTTPRLYGGTGALQPPLIYMLDREQSFATTVTILEQAMESDPAALRLPLTIDDALSLDMATVSNAELVTYDRLPIVARGEVVGVITKDAADSLIVNGFTLTTVFSNTNTEPDVDIDEDGTLDSWRFTGSFEAEPVWVF